MLSRIFERFIQESPVSVMMRGLMEYIFKAEQMDAIFTAHAQVQYQRELLFSSVVEVMSLVVCGIHPSVNAAYRAQAKTLNISRRSFYDKLNGIEPRVSAALVRAMANQLSDLIESMGGNGAEEVPGYRLKILDGNCLSGSDHRLAVLRQTASAALPGKSLVVLDLYSGLATEIFACLDGHAQERSLFESVLQSVHPKEIWIADRNMCTVGFLFGLQADFIIRSHQSMPWKAVSELQWQAQVATGEIWEQSVHLEQGGRSLPMRRIVLRLLKATRNGEQAIIVFTLLPTSVAPATKVMQLYRERRSIENLFQSLTVNVECEIQTLGYPKVALFSFSLALVTYNILVTVRAALGSVHGVEKISAGLSDFYLVDEIQSTYRGMMIAIEPSHWLIFEQFSNQQMTEVLQSLAAQVYLASFLKHLRAEKKKKPSLSYDPKHPHVSTAKLLSQNRKTP